MKKTRRRLPLLLTLLLALTLCLPALAAESAEEEKIYLLDAFIGTKLDLTPYEGKAILLNFFTEWCPYCMQEMPDIKKAFETYSPDQLEIILIHVWDGEDETNSENIRTKFGLEEMHFFEDEDMMIAGLVGIPGYPTSIFIDKEGNFAGFYGQAMTEEMLARALDAMGVAKATEEAAQ